MRTRKPPVEEDAAVEVLGGGGSEMGEGVRSDEEFRCRFEGLRCRSTGGGSYTGLPSENWKTAGQISCIRGRRMLTACFASGISTWVIYT